MLGTFIMGASFNMFYGPNNILLGGFSGIATIIRDLLSKAGINFRCQ